MDQSVVLLVDSDVPFRGFAASMLQREFLVVPASNGNQALQVSRCIRCDLLLADVPPRCGEDVEFVERIREENPGIKVLLMVDEEPVLRALIAEKGYSHIAKPFTPAALVRTVRDLCL
jgi:DNA-binding NtrC family response regulator